MRSVYTRAVHAGEIDRSQGDRPTVGPIYASNTFLAASPETMDRILGNQEFGFTYTRHHNPTVTALAEAVADLEGGGKAVAYGSGMAALAGALLAVPLSQGDRILAAQDLYGASINLMQEVLGPLGVGSWFEDLTDLGRVEQLLRDIRPRAVLVESISNPLLRLVDGPSLARICHAAGVTLVVDNTFATPLLQRPLEWGADLVVHSATKYLSGHGDVTAGLVVTRSPELFARLERQVKLTGGILGPFEAWLVHRGIKTLPLRYLRQCDSALQLACGLVGSGLFPRVVHPLLGNHPDHARALQLFPEGRCGAVVTLDLPGGRETVYRFMSFLELALSATTVGDLYTLCLYPVMSSHRNMAPEARERVGVHESTVRISVGIEDPDEILGDILQAARRSISGADQTATPG